MILGGGRPRMCQVMDIWESRERTVHSLCVGEFTIGWRTGVEGWIRAGALEVELTVYEPCFRWTCSYLNKLTQSLGSLTEKLPVVLKILLNYSKPLPCKIGPTNFWALFWPCDIYSPNLLLCTCSYLTKSIFCFETFSYDRCLLWVSPICLAMC